MLAKKINAKLKVHEHNADSLIIKAMQYDLKTKTIMLYETSEFHA